MNRWTKPALATFAIALASWAAAGPLAYTAEAIDGQVVDAQTGRPIEGAIVLPQWILSWPGSRHGGEGGALHTVEVVTDAQGRYHIAEWGPLPVPPAAFLDFKDLELRIFRPGYLARIVANTPTSEQHRNTAARRTSEWNGKAIALTAFDGGNWPGYAFRLDMLWKRDDCVRACPRLVLALDAESRRIDRLAPRQPSIPYSFDIDSLDVADRAFLKAFKP